jgi:signal transduction histidine kinase
VLLEDRQGNILAGTEKGMSVYSKFSGRFSNIILSDKPYGNIVRALMQDSQGTIWIGTDRGLKQFFRGKIFESGFDFPPIKVTCMLEDRQKNLWAGTEEGLYRISAGEWTRFTETDGLPHHMIFSLLEDTNGNIMVGTGRGLGCFRNGTFTIPAALQGVSGNECFSILEDHRHYLWIGTSTGIKRFDGKSIKLLTVEKDGIISDSWLPGACCKDRDGNLLFGSTKGITRINPHLDETANLPPLIHINRVKVRDQVISNIGSLPYYRNYLTFNFSGLCFTYPQGVSYRYQLVGLDDQWIDTKERTVSYPYLPPGAYTFRVKAISIEGIESRETAEISFEILSPFWQTWWFRVVAGITIFGIMGILIFWRYKRGRDKAVLKEKNRQLMMAQRMELVGTLAAGAAHDLKNLLAIILGYSQMVKSQFEADDPRIMPAEYIKDTARTAVNVVKEILAFSKQSEGQTILANLSDLLTEIVKIAEVLLPSININWVPPPEEVLFVINPTHFHQVLVNLCLNAWDAMPKGGTLEISLYKDVTTHTIVLKVSDTGTGIPADMLEKIFEPMYTTKAHGKGTGLGLFVVKQMVEQYRGKISVDSIQGQGATFIITLPGNLVTPPKHPLNVDLRTDISCQLTGPKRKKIH